MLGRERAPVDRIREQHFGAHRVLKRQAALVVLVDAALHATVEPGEDDVDGAVQHAGFFKDRSQRRPRPFGGADCFAEPGLTHRPWMQARAAVACAFECHSKGGRGPRH